MSARVQTVVAGAGVVGLAVARALAISGREVLVCESELLAGSVTSSRNSGVVHAGIYYAQGSLKARTCVDGRAHLYRFCEEMGVAHRRCGKLIVATEEAQLATLKMLRQKAEANGVSGADALHLLSAEEVREREPEVSCVGALFSPATGIVDAHELMVALQGGAEAHGAIVALGSPVLGGSPLRAGKGQGGRLRVRTPELELHCDELVNCAGHGAPRVARSLVGVEPSSLPQQHFAKGNYYSLRGRSPFSCLVYPVPEEAGLGVHATLDLGGQCRFGPDVEWVSPGANGELDYQVDPSRADIFYDEVRRYWPGLPDGSLVPDYAGVRPKIQAAGEPSKDFVVQTKKHHGIAGLVNLFGIESPGLTASLALASLVRDVLDMGNE
jgi:L-2-hydroxyglutarate oxidase LhgO